MPIYEYQCNVCGHEFDVLQKIGEKPLKVCPKCHKRRVTRLVSVSSFQLKGTGWYKTDFKPAKSEKSEKIETSSGLEKPAEAAKSDNKTESKKEEKPKVTPKE